MTTYRDVIDFLQARLFLKRISIDLDKKSVRCRGAYSYIAFPIVAQEKKKVLGLLIKTRTTVIGNIYLQPSILVPWPHNGDWWDAYIGEESLMIEVMNLEKYGAIIQEILSATERKFPGVNIDIVLSGS